MRFLDYKLAVGGFAYRIRICEILEKGTCRAEFGFEVTNPGNLRREMADLVEKPAETYTVTSSGEVELEIEP